MGRKHRAFFRICVMDSRVQRDGKAIEEVGFYDPMVQDKAARVKLNMERVDYWMSVGAQPSEKVNALIRKVKTNKFGTGSGSAQQCLLQRLKKKLLRRRKQPMQLNRRKQLQSSFHAV
jgi:ribosomal protein S16